MRSNRDIVRTTEIPKRLGDAEGKRASLCAIRSRCGGKESEEALAPLVGGKEKGGGNKLSDGLTSKSFRVVSSNVTMKWRMEEGGDILRTGV